MGAARASPVDPIEMGVNLPRTLDPEEKEGLKNRKNELDITVQLLNLKQTGLQIEADKLLGE